MVEPKLIGLEKFCVNGKISIAGICKLPQIEKAGNLLTKQIKIIQRIIRINTKAKENFSIWEQTINDKFIPDEFHFLQEELIFHIRRAVDEMLSLTGLLSKCKIDQLSEINEIRIKDIGSYLDKSNADFHYFHEHIDFLNLLNDLANSYKHSFLDSDKPIIGGCEPCISTLYMKKRKTDNYELYNVSQNKLMAMFDQFFITYTVYLNTY